MTTNSSISLNLVLQQYRNEILARRAAAHEENIRDLMAPTKSWFGLVTKQRSLEEAKALYKNSMEQHLTNARAGRWLDEAEGLLVIAKYGGNIADRMPTDFANVLRAEGFL